MAETPQRISTSTPPEQQELALRLVVRLAQALDEANCDDIAVLDVRRLSQVTDYMVIATGTSDRQMDTAGVRCEEAAEELGESIFRKQSDTTGTWIVLDFVDVVAHIFEPATRAHYDLELLWGDAPRVEWTPIRPGPGARRGGAAGG